MSSRKAKEWAVPALAAALLLVLLAGPGLTQSWLEQGKNGAIALVNGEPIPVAKFNIMLKRVLPQLYFHRRYTPERVSTKKEQILRIFIEEELLIQEGIRKGVKISNAQINEYVKELKQSYPGQADVNAVVLKHWGVRENVKGEIERQLIEKEILKQEVDDKVRVTTDDLRDYYEENPREFLQPERVRLQEILIKVDPSSLRPAIERKRQIAQKVLEEARSGTPFERLVELHSESDTKAKGGDAGYMNRDQMPKEMGEELFNSSEGSLHGPFRSLYGFVIFKVVGIEPPRQLFFEEVRDSLEKKLVEEARARRKRELIASLRGRANIVIYLGSPLAPEPPR